MTGEKRQQQLKVVDNFFRLACERIHISFVDGWPRRERTRDLSKLLLLLLRFSPLLIEPMAVASNRYATNQCMTLNN
jgi:hypothetical protein